MDIVFPYSPIYAPDGLARVPPMDIVFTRRRQRPVADADGPPELSGRTEDAMSLRLLRIVLARIRLAGQAIAKCSNALP